jgi:NAD(P)-dependent dehydrogenase (short-subunit alcohol dehydrogenase family)
VAVITGANRGIGAATALGLARAGLHVTLVARTASRGQEAAEELAEEAGPGSGGFSWVAGDLGRADAVERVAAELLDQHPRIHLLVNNAGVMNRRFRLTADGLEETLAVNHLATVRLTHRLLPALLAAAQGPGEAPFGAAESRIVILSSGAHARRLDLTAFEGPKGYAGRHAYGQSKLLNLLHAFDLARRLEGSGVQVNAVHPGLVGTGLLYDFLPDGVVRRLLTPVLRLVSRTPEEGARTPLRVALDPALAGVAGRYFRDEDEADPAPVARDREIQEGVRAWTHGLTGVDWGAIPRHPPE